jgi:isobutyryl-CoA mutase
MGVNTFLSSKGSPTIIPKQVIRATKAEQEYQISMLGQLHKTWEAENKVRIQQLRETALHSGNLFESLMEAAKYCSLGQITQALFEVGGQYRRNM